MVTLRVPDAMFATVAEKKLKMLLFEIVFSVESGG